jgi:hypothetical protein
MLAEVFPDYESRAAIGLSGDGSEAYGYDDEISRDHDFGAGFCIWLTDADYEKLCDQLNLAFEKLPTLYKGFPRRDLDCHGVNRIGAMKTSEFYMRYTGLARVPREHFEWRRIPEHLLAAATNGEVFHDNHGDFTRIRQGLLAHYPADIRLKKLAACCARMAQSGQYNYNRCLKRGERVAALSALGEFIDAAGSAVYCINQKYKPYYKWAHRGLRDINILPAVHSQLSHIEEALRANNETTVSGLIEEICDSVASELKREGLSRSDSDFLLDHAYEVGSHIEDSALRALNVFVE